MFRLVDTSIVDAAAALFERLDQLDAETRIDTINAIRQALRAHSPMKDEPVDCVLWVPAASVVANDYNPNVVASPEMRLLTHSIREDGLTQPVVAWVDGESYQVVDGFHRSKVGKGTPDIRKRLMGRLPITLINEGRSDKGDRIASTIRHNRARGKHTVDGMSDIVLDLARRNWSDAKIARDLGMEPDEVLRLRQVGGLAELFADREFSEAWEVA